MARPKSPLLDREVIVQAALHALDERGAFTMPGIAKDLGVAVSSLYHHVPSREQLLELIRGQIAVDLADHVDWERPWDEVVRQWVISYRNAFGAHPDLVRALTAQTVRAPSVLEGYDRLATLLLHTGFPLARILDIVTLLDTISLGSALDMAAPDEVWEVSSLATDSAMAQAMRAAPSGAERADSSLVFALDVVISGLRHDLESTRPGSARRTST